ncbi:hypothetical protein ECRN5871_4538 [Escherichia coli RN587/1]|nr:hypothetical protein ECRN5871_4538 [Escherichia coli RN587/1]EKI20673.1 hypothetical protein ECARS42123_5129 [Escherichia coli ARS4.2123]
MHKKRDGKPVPSRTEGKSFPEVQPRQLPHTACLCQKICWSCQRWMKSGSSAT